MVNENAETVFSAALQRNHLARSRRPLEDEVKPSALGVVGNLVAFPDEQQIGLVGFLFVDQDVLRCLGCPEILSNIAISCLALIRYSSQGVEHVFLFLFLSSSPVSANPAITRREMRSPNVVAHTGVTPGGDTQHYWRSPVQIAPLGTFDTAVVRWPQ